MSCKLLVMLVCAAVAPAAWAIEGADVAQVTEENGVTIIHGHVGAPPVVMNYGVEVLPPVHGPDNDPFSGWRATAELRRAALAATRPQVPAQRAAPPPPWTYTPSDQRYTPKTDWTYHRRVGEYTPKPTSAFEYTPKRNWSYTGKSDREWR